MPSSLVSTSSDHSRYHPDFHKPNEFNLTTLKSEDDILFQFHLPLLSILSPFFNTIPSLEPGEPLYLPSASSESLAFCLKIILSFSDSAPIPVIDPKTVGMVFEGVLRICDAYDLRPVLTHIYRCRQTIFQSLNKSGAIHTFLDFTLALLSNNPEAARESAIDSLKYGMGKIPKWIRNVLVGYAPIQLIQLHEYHISHVKSFERLKEDLVDDTKSHTPGGEIFSRKCEVRCETLRQYHCDWERFKYVAAWRVARAVEHLREGDEIDDAMIDTLKDLSNCDRCWRDCDFSSEQGGKLEGYGIGRG
ncbi:hypothetical protein TREMEDRAFT_60646 [Tremella mesenterica DSM 1558]|uniref:uncharacterized protein n=1 Tax=Tremella mesenterica (strain ATCC 24925 / CBS 8224 / DSM 1558 / NBRC 9311 / NRRL Y-6157 / RJB 2259-6 / UBC 559-6) TaxID=578456 RepID=UPI0003F4A1B6|nr:uncharacterized protein TREMEDRAFT_60646 [Tremella mesenterica DSM 1558]EIW71730.1 hypothetical protein TREMEDRAFT_60646 [Tremella mesenterica DSM 1558]